MSMNDAQQKAAAKKFSEYWAGKGYEKGESQKFWIDLLVNVFDVENISEFISFEDQVHLDHTSFIDGYIPTTRVMIEQKSIGKDLRKPIKQSDGSMLNPFQQAKRYVTELPLSQHPRWIITCNFEEFLVYDMEKPNGEPEQIFLKDLPKDYYRLQFIVETGSEMLKREMEISLKAGELVGKLYDAILKQYKDPEAPETLRSLNMLCVRLVFCLYAEDTELFGKHEQFGHYLRQFQSKDVRKALIELFQVLDTKPEDRDPYMDDDLASFPYVNGGLFAEQNIEIPRFTDEIVDLLLDKASAGFDWSEISPTIFGAVFESTLNPETRRSGGMHYTSIQNIHKVIDPLFLDDLTKELDGILDIKVDKTRRTRIGEFTDKLASLTFLDPACGSGNFLTETFLSLRKLENKALESLFYGQIMLDTGDIIKVGIGQFYGIEINDFAATVAKTALWIAEHQMIQETQKIVHKDIDFLPLKTYTNITEGNALRIDWKDVIAPEKLNYIMGNPPFVGSKKRQQDQRDDVKSVLAGFDNAGNLDYVACWFKKAADLITGTNIRCAFVATNSITQGEEVATLWKPLTESGTHIDFAYRTFRWDSEASVKAQVHCVIVGFSKSNEIKEKNIFISDSQSLKADNINGYLMDAPDIFLDRRNKPICNVPEIIMGPMSLSGNNLILTKEEKENIISKEPQSEKWIRRFSMGREFIDGSERYCLWLKDISPAELKSLPMIYSKVKACKEFRESQTKSGDAYKYKDTPHLFRPSLKFDETQPYFAMPQTSTQNRRYIPMAFVNNGMIPGQKLYIISNADLYLFGVMTSNVHMAWTRAVCGRMKSDYSYSVFIVYNNFPWCDPTPEQKAKIEETAQAILDARAKYPDSSLADLYDDVTMPPELRKAHQANDVAVMRAYGLSTKGDVTESSCVAFLFEKYREITEGKS